jgi:hypothetical protein
VNNYLIAAIFLFQVVEVALVAFAFWWIKNWLTAVLRDVLVPWMRRIHDDITGKSS